MQSLATVTVIDPTPPPDPNGVAGDEAFAWHRGVVEGLVTLVDVPLVSAATVRAVVESYRVTHAPVVRPTSGARHGHPLLLDRSVFAALRAAAPETGAKPIVRAHASPAGDIPIDDEGAFTDIDTPGEYQRLAGLF